MILDTFFSASRFTLVVRKVILENGKVYLLRLLAMYGTIALIMCLNAFSYDYTQTNYLENRVWQGEIQIFPFCLFLWGTLGASTLMENFKYKASRTTALMLPATQFEQFFARWLIHVPLFLLIFLFAFYLASCTRSLLCVIFYPDSYLVGPIPLLATLVRDESGLAFLFANSLNLVTAFSFFLLVQSFFVLGSVVWPKNAFLKTFAALAILFILYMIFAFGLFEQHFISRSYRTPFDDISSETVQWVFACALCLLAVFNWVLAYFRFKEIEIINRW